MPKNNKRRFGMAVSSNVLEILIYEDIGASWWGDGGITCSTISARLAAVGSFDSISLRLNSLGGDCFEGIGIYNLLRAQEKPIEVFVDGLAASAASIIAMAGDTINIGTGAMLMIHNAAIFAYGEAGELRKMADTLDTISVTAGEIYVKRTGQTADKIKEMMDAETWLNGAQALDLGFATEVVELDDEQGAQALAREFSMQAIDAGFFRNAPKTWARQRARQQRKPRAAQGDCTCPCDPCVQGDCVDCTVEDCANEGCSCPQHEEMASGTDPELRYFQHRLAHHTR